MNIIALSRRSLSVQWRLSSCRPAVGRPFPTAFSRCFSTGSGNGGGDGKSDSEDPFGVNYVDASSEGSSEEAAASHNIGPKDELPPNYIRDATTGKFTGKIQLQMSKEQEALLNLSPLAKQRLLTKKFTDAVESEKLHLPSRRIREEQTAFNILGRKVQDISDATATAPHNHNTSDANTNSNPNSKYSAPLTEDEFKSLGKFMRKGIETDQEKEAVDNIIRSAQNEDLIPVTRMSSSQKGKGSNQDLDLEWTTMAAQRSMTDVDEENLDDPLANLMPSDLNPSKKVNRKRAKLLPTELLHHNNLALLRRYVTPGGQIMNRVQSRLGAKDQRKIAKLVKRARHLGLIPVIGQWKVEDHGNIKEDDILQNRDWENELLERGLINPKSKVYGNDDENDTSAMW